MRLTNREIPFEPDATDLEIPAPTEPGMVTNDDIVPCPYCGTDNSLFLEPPVESGTQEFEEECRQCGRTYFLRIEGVPGGRVRIHAERLPD